MDNWHSFGILVQRFGTRIVYDAVSRLDARAADFFGDGGWQMLTVSRDLRLISDTLPAYWMTRNDEVKSTLTGTGVFSVKSAWNALRVCKLEVEWYKLVWHKDYNLHCSFIVWVTAKDGLRTLDRLKRWGYSF